MDRTTAETINPLIGASGFSETAARCADSLSQIATLLNEQEGGNNKDLFWLFQTVIGALRYEVEADSAAVATRAAVSRAAQG